MARAAASHVDLIEKPEIDTKADELGVRLSSEDEADERLDAYDLSNPAGAQLVPRGARSLEACRTTKTFVVGSLAMARASDANAGRRQRDHERLAEGAHEAGSRREVPREVAGTEVGS